MLSNLIAAINPFFFFFLQIDQEFDVHEKQVILKHPQTLQCLHNLVTINLLQSKPNTLKLH